MKDPRMEKLARNLINYSTKLKKGENILIEAFDVPDEMVIALVKEARAVGGNPVVAIKRNQIMRELLKHTDKEHMSLIGECEKYQMEKMQAYIGVRGSNNISEMGDVATKQMKFYQSHWMKPVHYEVRVPKTRWVVLRYPTPSMAQQAHTSTEAFEDFYFKVCNLDYSKMNKALDPLKRLMERTDKVRLVARDTDLTFSIKGIPAVKCAGELNIPDGEIFTAPVKDSINGVIHYNTTTLYQGTTFDNIRLKFKKGKIIEATGSDTKKVNEILNSDAGARYTGEFAIGINPFIKTPMNDTLFDEKIMGSIHLTPGNSYDEAPNGNKSEIHWDMVLIQTPEYGGGEIWFDDQLIRKDGRFVLKELKCLNPENLV